MKKEAITVQMDAEKLRAVKRYMKKKDADLEQELCDQLQRLYEKFVPANVREYIDESADIETPPSTLPKKQKEKIRQTAEPRQADEP